MRAILNTMGATLWGAIAISLAAAVAILGYRASLSYRSEYPTASSATPRLHETRPNDAPADTEAVNAEPHPHPLATVRRHGRAANQHVASANPGVTTLQTEPDSTPEALADKPVLIGHYLPPVEPDPRVISRLIGKEMISAQKALQSQRWQEALLNLETAKQKSGLTPFDQKTVYDYEGYAYVHLNNYKMAQQEYEAALATGAYPADEAAKTTRTLFRLAAQNQQYAKAIDFGKQVSDLGGAMGDDLGVMAQLYYLQKDCKDSAVWADKAIAAARKAGEAPKENSYQFKLQCASDAGDTAAMDGILMDLVRLTNKTMYWNPLLRIERQDERGDHNTLMIYRIMYNTNSMNADTDYIEMAQLLGDAALPGEAAAVLDKAMATGVIKDEHKERTNRLLTALEGRADSDEKSLPEEATEANQSAAGELLVELGEVYYGFGEYQKTIDAITQGLQKGSVTQMDEALVYLGLAQMQLKSYADAKNTFAGIPATSIVSPRLARLWRLYAAAIPAG